MKLLVLLMALVSPPAAPRKPPPPPSPPVEAVCRGVPETETHLAVLVSTANVVRVEELRAGVRLEDFSVAIGNGARVVIEARPFATAEWLQRAVNCHLARVAQGAPRLETPSPLDVPGISVRVLPEPDELVLDVTSDDRVAVNEILLRARALVASR